MLKIYCKGSINNTGKIEANGSTRYGSGGGGGIVILASTKSVNTQEGSISVKGGNGTDSIFNQGPGGGGGGGIVILVAPEVIRGK